MSFYPEVRENTAHIERIVKSEEERFLQTLKTGSDMLNEYLEELKHENKTMLSGEKAFLLHDTYGFPLDLTKEICQEQNLTVDEKAFDDELEKQRERGRANVVAAYVNFSAINPADYTDTKFTGYDTMTDTAKVLDVIKTKDATLVITDKTPFYAEMGGQVGDVGTIFCGNAKFEVTGTSKAENVFMHSGKFTTSETFEKGAEVKLEVNKAVRKAIMRNHTATHILHKALQEILGDHVKQAGSLVSPERLRFDFTHFEAISAETLEQVENRVNEEILEALNVHTDVKSYDEAIKTGATALFGEKYGDTVRIVNVGNYSKEFCGGTHIGNSAEIGLFSITSESSVAAGVRRIEAVTGTAALEELHQMKHFEKNVAKALDCDNKSILQKIEKLNTESRELRKELEQMKKENAKGQVANIQNNAKVVNGVSIIKAKINGMSVDEMKGMADELVGNAGSNIAVLLGTASDKANFVLKVSSDLVKKGVHAGKLIKEIAKIAGGNGGGRPDMASAGGKDANKLEEALNAGEEMIGKALA